MPYEFVNDTGVIVADTSELQTEVQDEYKGVLGDDINLAPENLPGVLITAETTSRAGVATNNAQLANQINPNLAGGVFLDALWALTGGTRDVATKSTFVTPPDVTGVPFITIPTGSIAATAAGDQFETLGNVTLDAAGEGSVFFASVETGAIAAGIATLTTIITGVLGWETVTNTVAATLGTATQSDISARRERNETLGRQGSATAVAVFSAVRAVADVNSLTFRENEKNVPITPTPPDNIDLVPHSLWVCVDGGSDPDVASALLSAKGVGANWNNGNSAIPVSEVVTDPTSGQPYTVLFDRPDLIPVLYEVTISPSTISNVVSIVEQAILAYAAGEIDLQEGLVVGADVSGWEASGAINIVEPGINVTLVRVTTVAAASLDTATIPIALFEKATVLLTSITVIVA